MEQIDNLLKTTLAEVERLLTTRTVVGEPIEVGGNTIIPLVSVGFGFGGGGGTGEDRKADKGATGSGGGTGGGGGVKPVALIIVDKQGSARVEPIRAAASVVEKLGEAVARVVQVGRETKEPPAASAG